MIELDLLPAVSSPNASPSTSPRDAEDFAAALHDASGRDAAAASDRRAKAGTADRPAAPDATDRNPTGDDAEPDTGSASADGVDEGVQAEETPKTPITNPTIGLPVEMVLSSTAAATEMSDTAISTEGETVTSAEMVDAGVGTAAVVASDTVADVAVDVGVVVSPPVDGSVVDGPSVDGSVVDGPSVDGSVVDIGATSEAPVLADGDLASATDQQPDPAGISPLDEGAESHTTIDVTVTAAAATTANDAEAAPSPAASPATSSPSAAVAAGATAGAGVDATAPTQATASPAATTVDPLAAADMAAAAEIDVPTPPQQIAEALRDVRRMADGSHRLSLQLHPEELGVVQLEVAVRDGQLHLRAATELEGTRRLLAASIPELREQLGEAGVSAGSLEVGAETAGGDRPARDADNSPSRVRRDEPTSTRPADGPEATTPTATGRLDVRL